jgi:hypothetical protein
MLIVNHTIHRKDSIGNSTYKDNFQLVDTKQEAREKVAHLIAIHGDELYCWAISQVIEASEPHWSDAEPILNIAEREKDVEANDG